MKQQSGHPKYKRVTPVVDLRRMTLEDKETGSDSSANKKNPNLIEGVKVRALHSLQLMCNSHICSTDEELPETKVHQSPPFKARAGLSRPVIWKRKNSENQSVFCQEEHGAKCNHRHGWWGRGGGGFNDGICVTHRTSVDPLSSSYSM